ncbi:cytosine/adenosine deaminase-related metal-dependent hydrolase [Rhizobium leguminosarum]|uniref:Cytosine/adenosine deaminase-related metal-dependent hydrolase n=1 Tax=Rhizobium leguminosarum TaxID=384 RepID=A0A7Z0J052_RHILE|nr:amidohydrolase family protein [Rhizobium leguminosarum]MBB5661841.1 cytosine/adenosine deaminase-related metal-dependent hydrolase [Rhizobium leguminosarum]MBB6219865.1 cytosine/adenosine deaminase-related metal-dependent hydrolase [Rhizobium leguminosarum]NYJ13313.1 cytosine/adenosine deaminase-related metal-dependent hydrolase [Rhizobium leguminosarum]
MSTPNTGRTLFKGGIVITMENKLPNLARGDVLVEGEKISAVGIDLASEGAQVIDAAGRIVMPGLVDAHHHMWLGVMRRLMPDVDDLFAYIEVIAETLGAHYRPADMFTSTRLTAAACLDAGITTVIDACHSSRSPEHTDAALDALQGSGIRALHMAGGAMDNKASSSHIPGDLKRLASKWGHSGRVRVGLFGQFNIEWWRVARDLDMRILTEFIGDLSKLGPEFDEPGLLGSHNIFNHCTRLPEETWKRLAAAGVNVTVNPRSDALFGFDDDRFAFQQAIDHGLTPALGIDLDTAFGSDMFGEMHALFGQQRSAMRYRRFRGEENAPAPITVESVLSAATVSGARAAGLENQIGSLAPGKQADIIVIRTDDVAVFPVTRAIGTVVHAVERSNVDTVMVAGSIRKHGGKLIGIDVDALSNEATGSLEHLLSASGYRADLFEEKCAPVLAA